MPRNSKEIQPKPVTPQEVADFAGHCTHIRSVWILVTRIWRDSSAAERDLADALSPSFFSEMATVLADYMVLAVSRITDPARDRRGNENFTIEMFVNSFSPESETGRKLESLRRRMDKLREKVEPARNKLVAHADREIISKGEAIGAAKWTEWDDFWVALEEFVNLLHQDALGKPREIVAGGVYGDAEMLLRAIRQSAYFDKLLRSDDPKIVEACKAVALPPAVAEEA
jgi:hypothetical protein